MISVILLRKLGNKLLIISDEVVQLDGTKNLGKENTISIK